MVSVSVLMPLLFVSDDGTVGDITAGEGPARVSCGNRSTQEGLAPMQAAPDLNGVPNIGMGAAHEAGTHPRAHAQRPSARRRGAGQSAAAGLFAGSRRANWHKNRV